MVDFFWFLHGLAFSHIIVIGLPNAWGLRSKFFSLRLKTFKSAIPHPAWAALPADLAPLTLMFPGCPEWPSAPTLPHLSQLLPSGHSAAQSLREQPPGPAVLTEQAPGPLASPQLLQSPTDPSEPHSVPQPLLIKFRSQTSYLPGHSLLGVYCIHSFFISIR